jgi:hypothetical protein
MHNYKNTLDTREWRVKSINMPGTWKDCLNSRSGLTCVLERMHFQMRTLRSADQYQTGLCPGSGADVRLHWRHTLVERQTRIYLTLQQRARAICRRETHAMEYCTTHVFISSWRNWHCKIREPVLSAEAALKVKGAARRASRQVQGESTHTSARQWQWANDKNSIYAAVGCTNRLRLPEENSDNVRLASISCYLDPLCRKKTFKVVILSLGQGVVFFKKLERVTQNDFYFENFNTKR